MDKQPRGNPLGSEERELELRQRLLARERFKVIGLVLIALLILVIAFLRFGKTIPWAAR